jgi:3-hydroxyacyl-CoA dehydrogenase
MTEPVNHVVKDGIAVIRIDNPPVNALSHAVRLGLLESFRSCRDADGVRAIVLYCAGRSFIAGADIREFGKPLKPPSLPDVINEIEASPIPVVAAIHGTALGGGLEVAMGAHYRVAAPAAKFGLPEVNLGLLPGAGGTQRLPRLVPISEAATTITGGKPIGASHALSIGLIDQISEETPERAGIAFAENLVADGHGPRPTSALPCNVIEADKFHDLRARVEKNARGAIAPVTCLEALQGAMELPFNDGIAQERALFFKLMESDQRAAMVHAFFSERKVAKIRELEGAAPRAADVIGVIGGGTMGAGIAASGLLNGLNVVLVERDAAAVRAANDRVIGILDGAVKRGKLSEQARERILTEQFQAQSEMTALSDADLVIEAVFESIDVKKDVFQQLDSICKEGAVLASNTSYLDLNKIAAFTNRPEDVIGLHFFSPAHVMRLLEIVVGEATAPDVVATGFALAKKLKKIAVRAGVCDGFIGNRILTAYNKANYNMVLDGASPYQIDKALTGFGLAMGPFAVADLAGLDIGFANRKRLAPTRDPKEQYPEFADRLCENGWLGQKTGMGFYIYDAPGKPGRPNPEAEAIIDAERKEKGIDAEDFSEEEIVTRYMAAHVNEAARIVEEGIALRPLDVDVTMINGYGFPRWRGGPLHYADTVGLDKILSDIERLSRADMHFWQPAPLLKRLAEYGNPFASLND